MGMKVKEAILTLNANVVIACERAGFDSATVKMLEDALNTIEDALKEQEPVEPEVRSDRSFAPSWYYCCGNCDEPIDPYDKYCRYCGRKQKWTK